MLFLRVIAWCGDEKFSLKKSCFYLYIRRKDVSNWSKTSAGKGYGPVSNEIDNVIKNYQKKYIFLRVIRLEENGGLGNALKIATESAKYNLIARMDSDDISLPNRFEEQLKYFMLHPTIDVVGGDIEEFINDESNIVGRRRVPQKNDEIREYMKKRCAFNHMSVMYKKTTIQLLMQIRLHWSRILVLNLKLVLETD